MDNRRQPPQSGRMKNIIAIALIVLLARIDLVGEPREPQDKTSIQQQVVEITAGSVVEVRLKSKEKLRGRLDELSTDGFAMKVAQGNQTVTRQIAFDDVKSLKRVGSKAKSFFAGVGIFYVAMVAIGLIVIAATGKPFNN
jgi:hypothetical protein